ncbi:MAG: SDR family oxidoreductase [Myxococcales bacterium]|nr:SDR family oxidoreductase [Myxococcales bacterium]HIK84812.1 SDR family oxidoreductase [Myxococcales bacterium]
MGLPEPPEIGASALPLGTFEGQSVIVTGGGTGLGKAIAVEFGRLGARVAILSRDEEHRAAGVSAVEATGATAVGFGVDIRDPAAVANAFDLVVAELGLPTVLVNNAAGNFPVPAEDMSPNAWRTVTDIVLNGTFYCSREFGRRHITALAASAASAPATSGGNIINIGAAYAWTGGPGFAHSAAAKAGVKNLTESLAVEWGPYGIRVNCLVPGLFPHDDETANIRSVPDRRKSEAKRCPAHRVGQPHELGWAATFLASPYASFISGHTLVVDGANWQRRAMLMPEFVPIREQMGRGPFDPSPTRKVQS